MTILVFADRNAASLAVQKMTAAMALSGSTFIFALPYPLADGRWYIPRPSDEAWMAGIGPYTEADGVGETTVGETARHVPTSVTNFQARAVLLSMPSATGQAGRTLFDDINDALHTEGGVALQAWEYANDVTRDGPLVNSLANSLGLSQTDLDTLFINAASITA